jgi:hypothetical protein
MLHLDRKVDLKVLMEAKKPQIAKAILSQRAALEVSQY